MCVISTKRGAQPVSHIALALSSQPVSGSARLIPPDVSTHYELVASDRGPAAAFYHQGSLWTDFAAHEKPAFHADLNASRLLMAHSRTQKRTLWYPVRQSVTEKPQGTSRWKQAATSSQGDSSQSQPAVFSRTHFHPVQSVTPTI